MRKITRESIDRDLARIVRNFRQFIADIEWWNNNRTDAPPMDCEDMKVGLQIALRAQREPDTLKREPILHELVTYMQKAEPAPKNDREEK